MPSQPAWLSSINTDDDTNNTVTYSHNHGIHMHNTDILSVLIHRHPVSESISYPIFVSRCMYMYSKHINVQVHNWCEENSKVNLEACRTWSATYPSDRTVGCVNIQTPLWAHIMMHKLLVMGCYSYGSKAVESQTVDQNSNWGNVFHTWFVAPILRSS